MTRENPYVGPTSFQQDDENYYFGRKRETNELASLLMARRLVLLYAQSGAGKTSLINAGLRPFLQKSERNFELLPVCRVNDSVRSTVPLTNIFTFNLIISMLGQNGLGENGSTSDMSQIQPEQFAKLTLSDFLLDLTIMYDNQVNCHISYAAPETEMGEVEQTADYDDAYSIRPRVLIIDQFEELFTSHPAMEDERKAFLTQLADVMAADPYLYVLLSMRGDYFELILPYVHLLPDGLRYRYHMERMRPKSALDAVIKPAKREKVEFDNVVAKKLVEYLRRVRDTSIGATGSPIQAGPYVEPVQLQVVCKQLWENLRLTPDDTITIEDVEQAAGRMLGQRTAQLIEDERTDSLAVFIDTALASYYEQAVKDVTSQQTLSEFVLRDWFSQRLITSSGQRNYLERGEAGIDEPIIKQLDEKHHLLRGDRRGGRPFIELTHDSFIQPILDANQRWRQTQAGKILWLIDATRYKENTDKTPLLSGERLEEAQQQWQVLDGEHNFPPEAKIYLEASQAMQEERDNKRKLFRKRLQLTFGIMAVLVLVALLVTLSFRNLALNAEEDEKGALEARGTAVVAQAIAEVAQEIAEQKAIELSETNRILDDKFKENEALIASQNHLVNSVSFLGLTNEYLNDNAFDSAMLLGIEAFKEIETAQLGIESSVIISETQKDIQDALRKAIERVQEMETGTSNKQDLTQLEIPTDVHELGELVCELVGRNLTSKEWAAAFPDDEDGSNTENCADYGHDFGPHISFVQKNLVEAETSLRNCSQDDLTFAIMKFDEASKLATRLQVGFPTNGFEPWAVQSLLDLFINNQSRYEANNCQMTVETLVGSRENSKQLEEIGNIIGDGREKLDELDFTSAMNLFNEASNLFETLSLPVKYSETFNDSLAQGWGEICTQGYVEACEKAGLVSELFDESNVSAHTNDVQFWRYNAQNQGAWVSIAMDAVDSSLDPYLILRDAAGNYLIDNDDGGGNLNALISSYFLPADDQYFVQATGFDDSSGAYQLTVNQEIPRLIAYGSTVTSQLDGSELWTFEGTAETVVSVMMASTSDFLVPNLVLFDLHGMVVQESYGFDFGGPVRIPYFILPEDGAYFIQTSGYFETDSNGSSFPYDLTLTQLEVETIGKDPIVSTTAEQSLWQFEGVVGTAVTIKLESIDPDIIPLMTLIGPEGYELTNGNSIGIQNFLLETSGTYLVGVDNTDSTLPYTITPTAIAPLTITSNVPATSTTFDQPAWQFMGTTGEIITIDLESTASEFDPYLRLIGPSGHELISDDDSGEGFNSYDARIQSFPLSETGTYTIIAGRSGSLVEYTLTLGIEIP